MSAFDLLEHKKTDDLTGREIDLKWTIDGERAQIQFLQIDYKELRSSASSSGSSEGFCLQSLNTLESSGHLVIQIYGNPLNF